MEMFTLSYAFSTSRKHIYPLFCLTRKTTSITATAATLPLQNANCLLPQIFGAITSNLARKQWERSLVALFCNTIARLF
jgi:hypothetical protein